MMPTHTQKKVESSKLAISLNILLRSYRMLANTELFGPSLAEELFVIVACLSVFLEFEMKVSGTQK